MQIRHKINLWIASLGLLINLVLAGFILFEASELAYETLDEELEIAIREDFKPLANVSPRQILDARVFESLLDFDEQYWIKVFDVNGKNVFASTLGKLVEIPFHPAKEQHNYDAVVPENSLLFQGNSIKSDKKNRHTLRFRVNHVKINAGGSVFFVQIARSVEALEHEIDELISIVVMGFCVAAIILLVLSHLLTNKILQPIIEINTLATEISASDMTRRIPLGKNIDEVYLLADSLNKMFDRLQHSFASQKQLLADAAHELKSPITMLLLFMERSMERRDLPMDYSSQLMNQTHILRRMGRLVKNLLEISSLDQKSSLHLEVFDLGRMVSEMLEDFEVMFEQAAIEIENNVPFTYQLVGDREKIQRLLINLVDNAAKYNRDKGKIKLDCVEKNNEIHISVWNTGVGIPVTELKQVLKKFYRVEKSRSQKYGGSGLGLTIVDKIARLHGGSIIMDSLPGKWCSATVTLPLLHRKKGA